MQFVQENQIEKLSLAEINQAQSFINFKRRWPARLRGLLYLGIILVLSSGAGSAMTNRDLHSHWETSPTTAHKFQQDYSQDQFFYRNSNLIFGGGFTLGLMCMAGGLFFFRKYKTCCAVECKLREREMKLVSAEYPRPKPTGKAELVQVKPLSPEERNQQYPMPDQPHPPTIIDPDQLSPALSD